MAEMALRFSLSEPTVGTVIPGTRSVKNVTANMAASDADPLAAGLFRPRPTPLGPSAERVVTVV